MYEDAQGKMYSVVEMIGWGFLKATEAAIRIFASYAKLITQAAAFILAAMSAYNLMSEPGTSALLILLSHLFVVYPILNAVFRILSLIPQWICKAIIAFLDSRRGKAGRDQEYNGWQGNSRSGQAYSRAEDGYRRAKNGTGRESSKEYSSGYTGSTGRTKDNEGNDELSEALRYFHLTMPYTENETRQRWKVLIKEAHPDAGGSEEDAKKINTYYELLKKYAT